MREEDESNIRSGWTDCDERSRKEYCPDCGYHLFPLEGCMICPVCGWSSCQ